MFSPTSNAQEVSIDGRLKPILDDFFAYCETYDIAYKEKFLQLKQIDIVETLWTSQQGSTLGMLQRDKNGMVENIVINWIAMLDPEILKIVAFHEFGHYFLDYKHTCQDCGEIMAVVNSSYFDIAKDWDNQVQLLFKNSPVFQNKNMAIPVDTFIDQ
jgi:Zn-dependent peptidase ImmA (M78 family)